jgi:putative transposase
VAGFIASQGAEHGIPAAVCCRALGVSRSWYYKWVAGWLPPRVERHQQLVIEVARLFVLHRGKFGSPRITADLREVGWRVSENTVAKIMREQRLVARPRRRRRGTTRPGKGRWRAPDLIGRDFHAERLNRKWFGDGTEIVTDEGKLQVASVLEICSRRVLGFAMSDHHDSALAYAALAMAVAVRGGKEAITGVIMHTDQGSEGRFKGSLQHRCLLAETIVEGRRPCSRVARFLLVPHWCGSCWRAGLVKGRPWPPA